MSEFNSYAKNNMARKQDLHKLSIFGNSCLYLLELFLWAVRLLQDLKEEDCSNVSLLKLIKHQLVETKGNNKQKISSVEVIKFLC